MTATSRSGLVIRTDLKLCIVLIALGAAVSVSADKDAGDGAEALPVHILGAHLQPRAMRALHPDLREGDAFLHNDPYLGNSHAADHALLVPVFVDGEHMFTACAKASLRIISSPVYCPSACRRMLSSLSGSWPGV